jgi:hypothetical protein
MSDAPRAIPAVGRRPVHTRRVVCEGFARDDGLFDIEGTLTDTKPFVLALPERVVDVGRPIHQMKVRLAIDRDFVIHEAEARTLHAPYAVCGDITDSYRQLVGLRIQPGFTQAVKRRFRGVLGCSHMTELLPPMATTAFQILWSKPDSFGGADARDSPLRSSPLGGCHALRLDGQVVRQHFPHLLCAARPVLRPNPDEGPFGHENE